MAPHVVVWWRDTEGGNTNLDHLGQASDPRRAFRLINANTRASLSLLNSFEGDKHIYGSWGYSPVDERIMKGLGRGLPSIDQAHLHVISLSEKSNQCLVDRDASSYQKLSRYNLWSKLLGAHLGESVAGPLRKAVSTERIDVIPGNDLSAPYHDGYQLTFAKEIDFCRSAKPPIENC